jgi:hypothetical protein
MSDICPILTEKDIQLIGQYAPQIAEIQASESMLDEYLSHCKEQSGGNGYGNKVTNMLIKILVVAILTLAAGGSAAIFLQIVPKNWQAYIISIVTQKIMPTHVCESRWDQAVGAAASYASSITPPIFGYRPFESMTCTKRSELFEEAIRKIMLVVGGATLLNKNSLEEKIKKYIFERQRTSSKYSTTYSTTGNGEKFDLYKKSGGKKKSKKYKKSKKSKKSKKNKKH